MAKTGKGGRRGFASMCYEKKSRISSLGGKAAHQKGTAHEWTSEEARIFGRLGGKASYAARIMRAAEPMAEAQV